MPSDREDLLIRRIGEIRRRHESSVAVAQRNLDDAKRLLKELTAKVSALEDGMARSRSSLTSDVDKLVGMKEDKLVLVRNYGNVTVYHSHDLPCGHANPNSCDVMYLSEARDLKLLPCDRCG